MKQAFLLAVLLGNSSLAQTQTSGNWLDSGHAKIQDTLQNTADGMNDWFVAEGADSDAARVKMRVMLDNRWNEYDGYSLRPRVRGSLRLPALEDRLSLVFGNEELEYQPENPANLSAESRHLADNRHFSLHETRRDNSSLGLRWSPPVKQENLQTDFGIGIRSGGDIYAKAEVNKTWYHPNNLQTYAEMIYRYGLKSEHYARSNLEVSHVPISGVISSSQMYINYQHQDSETVWNWGNSLSRKHMTGRDTWFNYGVYFGGEIENDRFMLNSYGPFAGMRFNAYRNWLFIQPELSYFNDKTQNRDHHIGAMLRFEAQF